MDAIQEHEYRGFIIKIHHDELYHSPREEFEPMGKMVCFHSRHNNLGDDHNFSTYDELMEYLKGEKGAVWLPLFLYDHSGLTMNTTGFNCRWDSGQVGVIYMTYDEIEKEYPKKDYPDQVDKAKKYLKGEVKTYDDFLTGNVYGYTIEPKDTNKNIECDDSCWGFYGDEAIEYIIKENAKPAIDHAIKKYRENTVKQVNERRKRNREMDRFMNTCWAY